MAKFQGWYEKNFVGTSCVNCLGSAALPCEADRQMDRQTAGKMNLQLDDEQTEKWTDGPIDGQTEGRQRTDGGQMESRQRSEGGQTEDRWTDGRTNRQRGAQIG